MRREIFIFLNVTQEATLFSMKKMTSDNVWSFMRQVRAYYHNKTDLSDKQNLTILSTLETRQLNNLWSTEYLMCEHDRHRKKSFYQSLMLRNRHMRKWSSIDAMQQFVLICTFRKKETVIKEEHKKLEVNNRWETARWRINDEFNWHYQTVQIFEKTSTGNLKFVNDKKKSVCMCILMMPQSSWWLYQFVIRQV